MWVCRSVRYGFYPTALVLIAWAHGVSCPLVTGDETRNDREDEQFFEREIRPLLAENCYRCHSARAAEVKGALRVDSRAGLLLGGESGAAIEPGHPDNSLLMSAVRYETLEMPPDRRMTAQEVETLAKWIRLGAPWPGSDDAATAKTTRRPNVFQLTDEDLSYWAYREIDRADFVRESPPATVSPIDMFVRDRLLARKLTPNAPATRRQLIRRAYFDLIGLPPSLDAIRAFENDRSPAAFEVVIDRLLAMPQYGERWGRHWLDVVRFAQSNGYERDGEKPFVWRFRDYVIRSFNDDKPYDRFVMEQLAGDELPDASASSVTATAFYRLGVWDDEPDDKRAAEFDGLDDMLSTIGQVFLGQTIGCARCHNHMFDPISQRDYYELLAFVRNVQPYENAKYEFSSSNYAPVAAPADVARWLSDRDAQLAELEQRKQATEDGEARKQLEQRIGQSRQDKGPFKEWTPAAREHGRTPHPTHMLIRGNAGTPGDEVQPRFLSILGGEIPNGMSDPHGLSSGRRTALAAWIASAANPLTARVIANRVWQHHFGRGIVRTPNDFGRAGVPPTHPMLLDWLAATLIDGDWSIKHLHKQIMLSATYQMSSAADNERALGSDPNNDLFWRQNLRRLDAEAIRDAMLSVSGELSQQMEGRGVFPTLSGEVLAGQSKPGWGWEVSPSDQLVRRSVYIYVKRGVRDPLMESFDYVNTTSPLGMRPVTTVAPQALVLLNSRFVHRRARVLAQQIRSTAGPGETDQITDLFRRTIGRDPTGIETKLAEEYLARQRIQQRPLLDVMTFRPDYPVSLIQEYRKRLRPEHYLLGPDVSWKYFTGVWTGGYESLDVVDFQRTPFALWSGPETDTIRVSGDLMIHNATRHASLYVAASADGDRVRGAEIRLTPQSGRLSIHWHGPDGVKELTSCDAGVAVEKWIKFEITLEDSDLTVKLDGDPSVRLAATVPGGRGRLGVTALKGALSLNHMTVEDGENEWTLARDRVDGDGTTRRLTVSDDDGVAALALQSLCVVVMNLNEFVYID